MYVYARVGLRTKVGVPELEAAHAYTDSKRSHTLSRLDLRLVEKRMNKRGKGQVNAFNLVPVVEQVLPDRQKAEVKSLVLRFLIEVHPYPTLYIIYTWYR